MVLREEAIGIVLLLVSEIRFLLDNILKEKKNLMSVMLLPLHSLLFPFLISQLYVVQDNPFNFSSLLMDDKIEPVNNNMVETTVKNEIGNFRMVRVKSGVGITYEFTKDDLDNMALSEKMKLYSKRRSPPFKIGRCYDPNPQVMMAPTKTHQ